jgi:hypothetical protein
MCRQNTVGVANRDGLEGPGIESRGRRDFPPAFRPALGPTQPSCTGRGMALITHPNLVPRLKKEYSYTSTPPHRALCSVTGLSGSAIPACIHHDKCKPRSERK